MTPLESMTKLRPNYDQTTTIKYDLLSTKLRPHSHRTAVSPLKVSHRFLLLHIGFADLCEWNSIHSCVHSSMELETCSWQLNFIFVASPWNLSWASKVGSKYSYSSTVYGALGLASSTYGKLISNSLSERRGTLKRTTLSERVTEIAIPEQERTVHCDLQNLEWDSNPLNEIHG